MTEIIFVLSTLGPVWLCTFILKYAIVQSGHGLCGENKAVLRMYLTFTFAEKWSIVGEIIIVFS